MSKIVPLELAQAKALMAGQRSYMATTIQHAGLFTAEECARIISLRETLGAKAAGVESRQQGVAGPIRREVVDEIRRTERTDLMPGAAHQWIYERLGALVELANQQSWHFELAFMEPIQLLTYPLGGHYGWHTDLGSRGIMALRKVSVTVQLSPVEDYDGGELEVQVGGRTSIPERPVGSAVLFPSYQPHRVRPVSRGTRHALVLWVIGRDSLK